MINEVILLGRLGADPELKRTAAGKEVCHMRVATSIGRGDKERVEWHRVEVWSHSAANCAKFLRKGSKVFVKGRLKSSDWTKDGQTVKTWAIVAYEVKFLDAKDEGGFHGR